jgi:hypothetical protein
LAPLDAGLRELAFGSKPYDCEYPWPCARLDLAFTELNLWFEPAAFYGVKNDFC